MKTLQAARIKLHNVIHKYDGLNPQAAIHELEIVLDEILAALGACDLCYGRGYVLLGSKSMEFCECQRGQHLCNFVRGAE